MSETLSPPQNEPQAWRQELKLRPEGYPALKPEESLTLAGSWTESKLEDTLESLKDLPGDELEKKTKVLRAALSELPNLDAQFGVLQAIADRKSQVENQLKEASERRNVRVSTELRTKIAGLDFLLGGYDGIEDNIKLSGQTSRERSVYVNELITEHNERVSRGSESIADSSEMQEAQARINARFAEQAKQPQPTEMVDDARQKVAEAFSGIGEKEQQALITEVAQAAKGATRIHTDRPKGVILKSNSGDYGPRDGFVSFGDGLPQENSHNREMLLYSGSAEALLFSPDTTTRYKTVTKTVETGRLFMKKTQQVEQQVRDGEMPTMVINPATGQQEPGIKVAYQFNGNTRQDKGQFVYYEGPAYITESGRGGNQLFVEATLPKSVAEKLKRAVSGNPEIAREFAKTLVINNGITEQVWNRVVRPPYDEVPGDWEMTVADLRLDQYGHHDVAARQTVRISR